MELTLREVESRDAASVAGLLGELGYRSTPAQAAERIERIAADPAKGHGRISELCGGALTGTLSVSMKEPLIAREEVIALLFNVSDIAVSLTKIERILGSDDGEEEADEG